MDAPDMALRQYLAVDFARRDMATPLKEVLHKSYFFPFWNRLR